MKLTICTLIAGIAAATAVQASDTRVFGERIMMPEDGSLFIGRISADGSTVLGNSSADYLVPNDLTGRAPDTFVLDTRSGAYQLANLDRAGAQTRAFAPVGLSSDGSVALMSDAYNSHGAAVFLRESGTTEHLPFQNPKAISGDGNTVAYIESTDEGTYVTLYNIQTDSSHRIPLAISSTAAVSLSSDARFVAIGEKSEITRYDMQSGSIATVPVGSSSTILMGNLTADGNKITYSTSTIGGWIFNFAEGTKQRFCEIASTTAVSENGSYAACDYGRKAVTIKNLSTAETKTINTPGHSFFALGGVSNGGTVVWGGNSPGTPYDNNGRPDLFITTFHAP